MPTSSADLAPTKLGFDLIAVLAVSAMARVELCRVTDGEPRGALVAVKRLPAEVVEDDELRSMFRDEIWMAAALDHPNVARVLSWGEDERGPYLVSEFVSGVPLARLMRTVFNTGEHFTERLGVFLASCVSGGLAAAHELRGPSGEFLALVHRELTPGNVLLGFDGTVKITDFGLAKAKHRVTFTAVGKTKGDPAYMSPEQVLGQPLDGRSDIFALGVLLYELFAQDLPWRIRSVRDALQSIVHGPSPDLGRACPRLDPVIVGMVNRCLAKSPDDRHPTVHVLKGELDRWLELHGYGQSRDHLARFVRRNAMRQMRWLERVLSGDADSFDPRDDSPFEPGGELEGSGESAVSLEAASFGPPGRVVSAEDEAAPPPPYASRSENSTVPPPRPPFGQTLSEAHTTRRPQTIGGLDIDDPATSPSTLGAIPSIDDPESAPTTIDRPRPRMGTVTLTAPRPRDAEPPIGSTTASSFAVTALGDGPAAHHRPPSEIYVTAARIVDGAEELATRAHLAAEDARSAAQLAEAAARQAERGAEAVRLVHEALRAYGEGKQERAGELLDRANELLSQP